MDSETGRVCAALRRVGSSWLERLWDPCGAEEMRGLADSIERGEIALGEAERMRGAAELAAGIEKGFRELFGAGDGPIEITSTKPHGEWCIVNGRHEGRGPSLTIALTNACIDADLHHRLEEE